MHDPQMHDHELMNYKYSCAIPSSADVYINIDHPVPNKPSF